ncbi:MAG TPA: restriction endonuclease [Bacteroidia bacterium]|nr:restriction endonuclease [Bacteroidia bacterium]
MRPLLEAINALGGSGIVEEINGKVAQSMDLPDSVIEQPYVSKKGNVDGRTRLEYDLAWARTYLKQLGLIQNSRRGVWILTAAGRSSLTNETMSFGGPQDGDTDSADLWRADLHKILKERISPAAFERLIQRVLRETGFAMVEVTGRSGDGGIDGRGIARINGILSFRVVFQCKRYSASVGAPAIRDFRGAMQGRADKGLLITTGSFTQDAIKEATRDGAIAIDLVDGEKLIEKLLELRLGVDVEMIEMIEKVSVNSDWFDEL